MAGWLNLDGLSRALFGLQDYSRTLPHRQVLVRIDEQRLLEGYLQIRKLRLAQIGPSGALCSDEIRVVEQRFGHVSVDQRCVFEIYVSEVPILQVLAAQVRADVGVLVMPRAFQASTPFLSNATCLLFAMRESRIVVRSNDSTVRGGVPQDDKGFPFPSR
jgi:hypothetical protein